jgi:hypothetical protein
MLLPGRLENTVKGAYVITAPTQLETTYTQYPCHCKTNDGRIRLKHVVEREGDNKRVAFRTEV